METRAKKMYNAKKRLNRENFMTKKFFLYFFLYSLSPLSSWTPLPNEVGIDRLAREGNKQDCISLITSILEQSSSLSPLLLKPLLEEEEEAFLSFSSVENNSPIQAIFLDISLYLSGDYDLAFPLIAHIPYPDEELLTPLFRFEQREKLIEKQWLQRMYHRGIKFFEKKQWQEAEEIFLTIAKKREDLGFFWTARAAEARGADRKQVQHYRKQVFTYWPDSFYAPEAYFCFYSVKEYFTNKEARRHLQSLPSFFPKSPLSLVAYYYLGLERTQKKGEIEPDWKKAIMYFSKVEEGYDRLSKEKALPMDEISYYQAIVHEAKRERGLAYFAIGQQASGTKQTIYTHYALQTLQELKKESPPSISQASLALDLAEIYLLQGKKNLAYSEWDFVLQTSTHSHELYSAYIGKALQAFEEKKFREALDFFSKGEEHGEGVLTTDEKLRLWMHQSQCLYSLSEFETAMQLLSRIINDPSVSSLRIEAMCLRAEIYEREGRMELAKKQWDAIQKKGGIWAKKALSQMMAIQKDH